MASSVDQGAGGLVGVVTRLVTPGQPEQWLVMLRWVAVVGMVTTTVAASQVVPALDLGLMLGLEAGLAALNVAWWVLLRLGQAPWACSVRVQLVLDTLAVTAMLWFSGGVGNPFASFLTFHIALAGLLGSQRTTLTVTPVAVAGALLLSQAPHLSWASPLWEVEEIRQLGHTVALAALGLITGLFVYFFVRRLDALRAQTVVSEKLAALGRTMGAIAHEINTPLGTILLAAKELEALGREAGQQEVADMARTVATEARRAADVIGLVRGYVRPDAARAVVNLGEMVPQHTQKELDRLAFKGSRQVVVREAVSVDVLTAALRQVLTNILANAVDATARTPEPVIQVVVAREGRFAVIRVQDNGPGVDRETLARLGEPFRTTKAAQGGTGLGLYVSTLLSQRLGATLRFDCEPGHGLQVTLRVPAQDPGK